MADDPMKEIEKWGAISTAVPAALAFLVFVLAIFILIKVNKLRAHLMDLKRSLTLLETEIKNVGILTVKKGDELSASIQRSAEVQAQATANAAAATTPTFHAQLSPIPRNEYNDDLMNRSILPTRAVGPPVPPKRSNSYYKSSYY